MEAKQAATIRKTLAAHGITQRQVATRVGISRMYFTDILYGRRTGVRVQERINRAIDELIVTKAEQDEQEEEGWQPLKPGEYRLTQL